MEENEKLQEEKPRKEACRIPVDARINDYGCLSFRKPLLEALGWHKRMPVEINKNPDGSIMVRKAWQHIDAFTVLIMDVKMIE